MICSLKFILAPQLHLDFQKRPIATSSICYLNVAWLWQGSYHQIEISRSFLFSYVFFDPNNYRMLAVSGTMYRMYANVVRSLLTEWCAATGQIPDTQYVFYPGRNTLQPIFFLQHAARTIKFQWVV
jgi:hypothetical protein